jgi:methionyl-tRNA formyltransferase
MEKFKIGYFADGPWSHETFNLLILDETISIEFIVPRTDTKDHTLKNLALENGIDYLYGVKINSSEFIEQASSYNCDVFVSMSFNQIFRKEIINIPHLKTINCHAGKLPFYRGRNILNWALINDEKEFGITVHYIDEGIDTGDIILQRLYPITDNDNYSTLLEVAFKECAALLNESIKLIQLGKVKRIKQSEIHPVGFYCGQRKECDEIIDWNQTSREIFNFVRSICEPGPIARTYCEGEEVKIKTVKLIKDAPKYKGIVGQLLSKTKDGFLIKTSDSFIEIIEFNGKLKVGKRLGI